MAEIIVRSPSLTLVGASACAACAGLVAYANANFAISVAAAVLLGVALRRWPIAIWGAILAVVLLFSNRAQEFVVLPAGTFTVYAYDALPVAAIVASWSFGASKSFGVGKTRLPLIFGTMFLGVVAFAWLRSIETVGLTDAMQARKLFPLVLAVAIPLAGNRLAQVSSRDIATVFSLAAIALAVRTAFLLATGAQTVHGGTREVADVSSVLGVERVFQTWEPFLAAAVGLTLLAYVLMAATVSPLHIIGLASSTVPLLFGFFRVAWVFAVLVGLLVFALARTRRRPKLVAGFAALCAVFLAASALMKTTGPSYIAQFVTRSSAITTDLDSYRTREYAAVWDEIKKEPIVGQGFGTEYRGSFTIFRSWAHNAYEWLWWRVGIIGLIAFIGLIATSMAIGVRSARYLRSADDRALAAGLTAALLFTALAANFHENFETGQTNLFIGLVIAQLLLFGRRLEEARVR
jgi:hypothetical protein